MRPRILLPAALTATLLTGCGISDPYNHPTRPPSTTTSSPTTTSRATTTNADPQHEQGGTIPPQPTARGLDTAHAALARYAAIDINWTARTVAAHQRELASISVGQARASALQAAATYGRDSTLQASHVANSGSVIAITAGQGPAAGSWVIVTREHTEGSGTYAGLPASTHVTLAHVEHTQHGWVISTWVPQT